MGRSDRVLSPDQSVWETVGERLCATSGISCGTRARSISLIYISGSLIPRPAHDTEIADIVGGSVTRSQRLAVRGAMIFTEGHFPQLLEEPDAGVDELMWQLTIAS